MLFSHVDIIDLWPTLSAFAQDVGLQYNTAKHIRRRGSIPSDLWKETVEAARRRSIEGVTYEALAAPIARSKAVSERRALS